MNPPEGNQSIIPYLTYGDAGAALAFLTSAFGFTERMRMEWEGDKIGHAEVVLGDSVLMLSSAFPEMGLQAPQDLPGNHGQVMVYVDDVDAHHAHAAANGATIDSDPEDQFWGDRMYRARDPQGHRWMFATHVKDVDPAEMAPPE